MHSRAKQETTTQPSNEETTPPNHLTQTGTKETDLSNVEQTITPDTTMQNQQTQDMPTLDTEILSPDPTREILLKYTPNGESKQTDNPNTQTPIREEWIIHNEILPDNKWNKAKKTRKTHTQHDVNIAQQTQTILKTTPPINFQFLDKHQQKAYIKATNLATTLGYNNKNQLHKLKLISTQEHIKYLQQLNPSKASHNKIVTFNIMEHSNSNNNSKNIITEEDLIFSVLNCTSLQESHLRSENSTPIL